MTWHNKNEPHIKLLFVFTKVLIKNIILQTRCWLLVTVIAQFTAKTTNSEKSYLLFATYLRLVQ